MNDVDSSHFEMGVALEAWAKRDPAAALAALQNVPLTEGQYNGLVSQINAASSGVTAPPPKKRWLEFG